MEGLGEDDKNRLTKRLDDISIFLPRPPVFLHSGVTGLQLLGMMPAQGPRSSPTTVSSANTQFDSAPPPEQQQQEQQSHKIASIRRKQQTPALTDMSPTLELQSLLQVSEYSNILGTYGL